MRNYSQLTQEPRYGIYIMLSKAYNQIEIANQIGVDKSTISHELKRNCGGRGYRNKQAHVLALDKRKGKASIIDDSIWAFIEILIRKDWSPE